MDGSNGQGFLNNLRGRLLLAGMGFLLLVFGLAFLSSHQEEGACISLDQGWEYRWLPGGDWESLGGEGVPSDRGDRNRLEMRISLPREYYPDPALYFKRINGVFSAEVGGKEIGRYGPDPLSDWEDPQQYPWQRMHLIRLPEDYGTRELTLRVYSPYPAIGVDSHPLLGSRGDLIRAMVRRNLSKFAVGMVVLFSGLFSLVLHLINRRNRLFLALGLLLLDIGVYFTAFTQVKDLLFPAYTFWMYADFLSLMLLPPAFLHFFRVVLPQGKLRVFPYLIRGYLAAAAGIILATLGGWFCLMDILPLFNALLILVVLLVFAVLLQAAAKKRKYSGILLGGVLILLLGVVNDALIGMGLSFWWITLSHWGVFAFVASLLLIAGLESERLFRQLEEYSESLEEKVRERTERLYALSIHDDLTGIYNRRYFDRCLENEVQRHRRNGQSLAVLIVDIDNFKLYNDSCGHLKGDVCLRRTAEAMNRCLQRPGDYLFRYGGEEFAVILANTGLGGAVRLGEKVRQEVLNEEMAFRESPVEDRVSVSIGVEAGVPRQDVSGKDMVDRADKRLYRAKEEGRNRVFS